MPKQLLCTLFVSALVACQTVPHETLLLTQQQVAMLEANGFQRVDDHWELGIPDRLLFDIDDSSLDPRHVMRLQELSRALVAAGIHGARIEGHTDSTGAAAYNRQLSSRRAETVRQTLIAAGMQAGAVTATGLGESNPIESNRTATGRQENRRVVIIVSPDDAASGPADGGAAGTGR